MSEIKLAGRSIEKWQVKESFMDFSSSILKIKTGGFIYNRRHSSAKPRSAKQTATTRLCVLTAISYTLYVVATCF